ncbi:MAG: hypothetical protein CMK46_11050 [Porticoccus sp.]|uniref:hypothetical protein n=2 Tax=Porticoccus hydrocarbonoclasticus TaxID=1073414 RepID=UPI000C585ACD|nr:hypothetical protein [Porticoccus hydrocarbonoclasticus]MBG58804.1 hypothetical protein [Porticoccus sp.]|tara:strand:+ start:8330 stop:9121 length:792 start_codon:yes stop_codon:yes gene_type:complete
MTGRYSLFQMWEPFRQSLIAGHLFYVEQARKRLMSQFTNLESEADKAAEQWLRDNGHRFNPDLHSSGDFEETALDVGLEFYELLKDMQSRTRLSVVAGMYHEWDKQLHQWMVDQMSGWCSGEKFEEAVWKTTLTDLADLVEPLGWTIRSELFFNQLKACRLVVNVYKHGNGDSLTQLKRKHPEYLHNPVDEWVGESCFKDLSHKHLSISEEQFQAFSDAIVSFWRDIPQDIYDHESAVMPEWLCKALGGSGNTASQQQGGRNR